VGLDAGCRLWSAGHFSDGFRQVYLLLDDYPLSESWNNKRVLSSLEGKMASLR
jgi:hypothetical protein